MNRKLRYTFFALTAVAFTACQDDGGLTDSGTAQPVVLSASVSNNSLTRVSNGTGPVATGTVTTGNYYFSYPYEKAAGTYECKTCVCEFNAGAGTVYPSLHGDRTPLQWTSDDLPMTTYRFMLDNVNTADNETVENYISDSLFFKTVLVDISGNEYKAALSTESSTNDIVWGKSDKIKRPGSNGSTTVNIKMTHRMSQVYVSIAESAISGLSEDQKTRNISVSITNIVKQPSTFNRADGTVALPESPVKETCPLVTDQSISTINSSGSQFTHDETNGKYTTPKLILPPQSLPDTDNRPRLQVKIGDKTYSSALPAGMIYQKDNIGAVLEFLPSVSLELRVTALKDKNGELEIQFLPVYHRDWVEIGEYEVNGSQNGVYNATDLENAITAYNNYVSTNNDYNGDTSEIAKYGYFTYSSGGTITGYVINLFTSIDTAPTTKFTVKEGMLITINYNGGYTIGDKTGDEADSDLFDTASSTDTTDDSSNSNTGGTEA